MASLLSGTTIGGHVAVHANNISTYALTSVPSNVITTSGGQTIAGITYFSNGESLNLYGIRGRFTNEYIHLYNKVGIGHPNGWGQGEGDTPGYGLSTYGGMNIAYGNGANSYINGYLRINKNWAGGDFGAEQLTIRGTYPSIALRSTQHNSKWLIHHASALQFYYGGTSDDNNWANKFEIPTDGNIWMAWANDYISNLLDAKQNASTAITTSNIGSQSVNYASSAGNADTVDGYHATNAAGGLAVINANGYWYPPSWINVGGAGIYSGTNNAHFLPNNNSAYGSWEIIGSRGGWSGIYFRDSANTLMANPNDSGFYNVTAGWQIEWYNGNLYISKQANGGGALATVIDSTTIGSQSVNYASSAGNADTVDGRHADYFYPASTDNGYSTGDIYGSGTHQRLWGTDSVQNLLAFRPPTSIEYSTDGVNWTATTATTGLWDNKMFGKWGGFNMAVGNNVGGWRYVRMTWVNFGYHFFSHFTLAHSTNGHSFNFVFQKSDLNGVFSGEAFRQNGISSWPGYTFTKHSNVSGWWDTRDIRFVFELNHNPDYPNNSISIGHIGLMGGYSGFTRLYDWDADRNMFFGGVIYAATGNSNNWNTAYGWGNHASAGYQAAATAITTSNIGSQSVSYADESGYSASSGSVEWTSVQNKPATFAPSAHTHDDRYYTESESDTRYAYKEGSSGTNFYANAYYQYEWTRIMGSGSKGIYWQEGDGAYWHIYPRNQADMRFRTGSGDGGIVGTVADETARGYIHWTTSNEIGFLSEDRSWVLRTWNRGVEVYGSMRAPIFYDSNDTTYYGDFAGTSWLRHLSVGDVNAANDGGWNARLNLTGSSHARLDVKSNSDGIITTIYSHTGQGVGRVGTSSNHPLAFMVNGGIAGYAYANYLQGVDSVRAPIFYDSADTTYYLDPNAGTSLKIAGGIVSTAANGAVLLKHENSEANAWIFQENAANWGLFWFNAGGQSGQTIGSYTTVGAELFGMNNAVTGFNPNSAWSGTNGDTRASWMLSNYSGYLWTQGTQYSETDMRAPIFYDSNNTGYYGNFASTSVMNAIRFGTSTNNATLYGNDDWGVRLTTDAGWIQFGPANSGWAHMYSNLNFYMNTHLWVSGGYKVAAWDYNNGGGALYATVFYDANDTGYYLDPNGTSNLLQLNTATRARWGMPRWWNDRSSFTSDQGYWTGTNGWGTGQGTWANAWQGGFSGWDIWGTGTDHPQGAGYVHAQGIVSGQHYANSSVGYGWMMVGAANATANRYWLRGKWDTTTSGWVEMITTGNIASQSVSYADESGYSASSGSVEWTSVQNKPATFTPSAHTHDDRYYTESEVDSLLSAKQNASTAITTGNIGSQSVSYATNSGSTSGNSRGVAIEGYGSSNFTFHQDSGTFGPFSGWHNYLIGNHGNGSNYYNTIIAMPFWGIPRYSRLEGGNQQGPWDFITQENIGSQSVNYATSAGSATNATNANRLDRYGIIYGDNWNSYYINNKLITASAHGFSGTNRPPKAYQYGSMMSFFNSGSDHWQMYIPENSGSSDIVDYKISFRSGWNGTWGSWRKLIDMNEAGVVAVSGNQGTGIEISSGVGYNQDPLTFLHLKGQADTGWRSLYIRLTGDATGQDIEFRRLAANGGNDLMWYTPRNQDVVIFEYQFQQGSDQRKKDNIQIIQNPIQKVKQLRGVEFDWNTGVYEGKHDIGVIAQDVEAIMPEAVSTQEDGYKTVAYTKLIPLLIETVKEQQALIENLTARLNALESK